MQTAALRRLRKQVLILLAEYLFAFSSVAYLIHREHPASGALFFFAVLPVVPLVAMFVRLGRYLGEEQDGYKRDMMIRCLLWGSAGAMTLHLVSGFLRIFEWQETLPPFSELWVFAVFMLIAKLSYRVANRVPADA